jgi:hypothetical protein
MAYCTKCGSPVDSEFCTSCGAKVEPANESKSETDASSQPLAAAAVPPPPDAPSTPQASPGSKRKPIFWILGGCLVLIVIGVIITVFTGVFIARKAGIDPDLAEKNPGLAAAKMMATLNPDIEVLSVDEDQGTIQLREKETGRTVTMNFEDIQEGKIVFKDSEDGEVSIQASGDDGMGEIEIRSSEGTVRMGSSSASQLPSWLPAYPGASDSGTFGFFSENSRTGSCAYQTNDSVKQVASYYEEALKDAGFEVYKNEAQLPEQGLLISLIAEESSTQRSAQVTVSRNEGRTAIQLVFQDGE